MKKVLIDHFWRSGVSYQSNVQSWLTQGIADGGTPPTAAQLTALSTFITSLGSLWTRCKTMNILHLGSKEFVKLNLVNPATFKYTESGTVSFSALNGCKSASSSYFNQGFKSDAFGGGALTMVTYISESVAGDSLQAPHGYCVNAAGTAFMSLLPKIAGNAQVQHATVGAESEANTNHKGLYIHTHASSNIVLYKDGVKSTTSAGLTSPAISIDRLVLARNNATVSAGVTAALHYAVAYNAFDAIFDAFSDADAAAFKTAFDTYKTAVSLP